MEVNADGIRVNDQLFPNSACRFSDHPQRPLDPQLYGTNSVEAGTVWVISSFNSYTFDSRYYGAILNLRFGTILARCGSALRKFLSSSIKLPAVAVMTETSTVRS